MFFIRLPKNLFMKMATIEASDRFTAEIILSHPWITRNFNSDIPMTCTENIKAFTQQKNFSMVYINYIRILIYEYIYL